MTHTEIEPWAAKTLLLLRSSNETSLEELRNLLMETLHQKYNGRKQYKPIPLLSGPVVEASDKSKTKDGKVSSIDLKSKSQATPSPIASINLTSPDSYASESDNSLSDGDSDMMILDISPCTVCKDATQAPWNKLAECSECHIFYHQQCHIPPIPDSDVSDPRNVWYCRTCTKTVNKPKPSSTTGSSSSSKDSKSSSSSTKPSSGRSNTASPSFGSKTFGGGVMSSKKSASSKNSSSSSSKVAPNLNMVSADKRLQIMKKKAAKKQEKRPNEESGNVSLLAIKYETPWALEGGLPLTAAGVQHGRVVSADKQFAALNFVSYNFLNLN